MTRRNTRITWFVLCWTLLFHYESLRAGYLNPLLKRELPKFPLLFPPAGWIMFFQVDRSYGFAEIYGVRDDRPHLLDPHDVFRTRALGYDNIHRNVLIGVLPHHRAEAFCRYLRRKFPAYDSFLVVYAHYPNLIDAPERLLRQVAYTCN